MSPDEVLIELANDRITHPLEALGSVTLGSNRQTG
jgi:hypothetical protein